MAFCKNCGTQFLDTAKFCGECGAVVGQVSQATQAQPPVQPEYTPPQQAQYTQQIQPNYQQAPPSYQQAPPSYQPAPPSYQPAPPSYQPAPPSYQPAPPSYQPAPPSYQPAQQEGMDALLCLVGGEKNKKYYTKAFAKVQRNALSFNFNAFLLGFPFFFWNKSMLPLGLSLVFGIVLMSMESVSIFIYCIILLAYSTFFGLAFDKYYYHYLVKINNKSIKMEPYARAKYLRKMTGTYWGGLTLWAAGSIMSGGIPNLINVAFYLVIVAIMS